MVEEEIHVFYCKMVFPKNKRQQHSEKCSVTSFRTTYSHLLSAKTLSKQFWLIKTTDRVAEKNVCWLLNCNSNQLAQQHYFSPTVFYIEKSLKTS